jgi:hypothetical protein
VLADGPFAGEEMAFLPPDVSPPVQAVWSGWTRQGFTAYLYEWHGEKTTDHGRTDTLVYRCTGRQVAADDIPPVVAEAAETWADGAELISRIFDVPPFVMFPGL